VTRKALEVVLEVGAEGGSITLRRDLSGRAPRFLLKKDESTMWALLDEEEGPAPPPRPPEEVGSTLAEALAAIDRYPRHRLHPLEVHPALAAEIETRVLARGGEEALERWRKRQSRWGGMRDR
jgi:hypothetical protein